MTAIAMTASRGGRRSPVARSLVWLAWIEGRCLVLHPVFLVAPVLAVLLVGPGSVTAGENVLLIVLVAFLSGFGYLALAAGALIATNLAASRDRRHRTEELLAATPLETASRTAGRLLAVTLMVAFTGLISVLVAVILRPWGAEPTMTLGENTVEFAPATVAQVVTFLVQGPLVVGLVAVLGVALARWIPAAVVGPLAAVGLFVVQIAFVWSQEASRWFAPLAVNTTPFEGAELAEPASVMGWHLVYLLGLAGMLAAVALARDTATRGVRVVAAAGAVLTVLGGVAQVVTGS